MYYKVLMTILEAMLMTTIIAKECAQLNLSIPLTHGY